MRKFKIICVVVVVVGVFFLWFVCFFFGEKMIEFGILGVKGVDCLMDDFVRYIIYFIFYYGFFFFLFILCLVFFIVNYVKIGVVIWKCKKVKIGEIILCFINGCVLNNLNILLD